MKKFSSILQSNNEFFTTAIGFIVLTGGLLLVVSKEDSFIIANSFHTPALDFIFGQITFLGDGLFPLFLCLFLLAIKKKELAIVLLLAFLFSGVAAQLIKLCVFAPRPKVSFQGTGYFPHYFDTARTGNRSYPSGHTTTAFAMAAILSFYSNNKFIKQLLFALAAIVGYSRVYLAHHFPADVLAGCVLGILSATLVVAVYRNPAFRIHGNAKRQESTISLQ